MSHAASSNESTKQQTIIWPMRSTQGLLALCSLIVVQILLTSRVTTAVCWKFKEHREQNIARVVGTLRSRKNTRHVFILGQLENYSIIHAPKIDLCLNYMWFFWN